MSSSTDILKKIKDEEIEYLDLSLQIQEELNMFQLLKME